MLLIIPSSEQEGPAAPHTLAPPPHGFFLPRCLCSGNWGVCSAGLEGAGADVWAVSGVETGNTGILQSRQQAGWVGPPPGSHQWGLAWKMFYLFTRAPC